MKPTDAWCNILSLVQYIMGLFFNFSVLSSLKKSAILTKRGTCLGPREQDQNVIFLLFFVFCVCKGVVLGSWGEAVLLLGILGAQTK